MNQFLIQHVFSHHVLTQRAFLENAVLQDGLLVAGLIAGIFLILSAKREFRRETRKRQKAFDALAARVAALAREAKRMPPAPSVKAPEPVAAVEPIAVDAPAAAPLMRPGLNLNWRVQALRLLRRGQDIAHVSTALGVSRREVELLIRVHQLASGRVPSRVLDLAGRSS